MSTLLAAHGTRNPAGVAMIGDLAEAVAQRLHEPVRVAFVDVLGPAPDEVLGALPGDEPVTVVPAFLARGYHVRADLPAHLRRAGHTRVQLAAALGPSTLLAHALADRLAQAGRRDGDAVVLAAAGSSDAQAVDDVRRTARQLSALLGRPVSIGFAAPPADSPFPAVAEAVRRARVGDARRVSVASFLLADGLFARRLAESGADVVAAPLGVHPRVVDLTCRRVLGARAVADSPSAYTARR